MLDLPLGIWNWWLAGLLGLLVGSFLNVVIHRLPLMLEQRWARECAELAGQEPQAEAPLSLAQPRSRCPGCGALIRWQQNIPLLSYVLLRGRCASCRTSISWRYPLVEALTGILFAAVVAVHGNGMAGLTTPAVLGDAAGLPALPLADCAVAMTVAPRATASCTAINPTPPLAPWTSTVRAFSMRLKRACLMRSGSRRRRNGSRKKRSVA